MVTSLLTRSRSISSISLAMSLICAPSPEPSTLSSCAFFSAIWRSAACCAAICASSLLSCRCWRPSRPALAPSPICSFIFCNRSLRDCCIFFRSPALGDGFGCPLPPGFSQLPFPGCFWAMSCCICWSASSNINARLLKLVMTYCWLLVIWSVSLSPKPPNASSMWWLMRPISRLTAGANCGMRRLSSNKESSTMRASSLSRRWVCPWST